MLTHQILRWQNVTAIRIYQKQTFSKNIAQDLQHANCNLQSAERALSIINNNIGKLISYSNRT